MLARETSALNTTSQAPLFHAESSFTFACFGKHYKGQQAANWSFAPLQKAEDAAQNAELCARLSEVFEALNVRVVLAPSPADSNGLFVSKALLSQEIPLTPHISLLRNGAYSADAAKLNPGEAGAFSAGGCPLIVAKSRNNFLFAHAGRNSLIDRERIMRSSDRPLRLQESVVDTVMLHLRAPADEVRVWVYGALHPDRYLHPLSGPYAAFNQSLRAYAPRRWGEEAASSMQEADGALRLDLPRLIRAQFARHGVSQVNLQHAYLDNEDEVWLDGTKGRPRNLFVVARRR